MKRVAQSRNCALVGIAVAALGICAGSGRELATLPLTALILLVVTPVLAQESQPNSPEAKHDNQINVNWLYGSYVPKEVPLESLDSKHRFKLYLRQTYTGFGIYIKTALFTIHDQIHKTYPKWGSDFEGFAKRFGTRQAGFLVQNPVIALGMACLAGSRATTAVVAADSGRGLAMPSLESSSPMTALLRSRWEWESISSQSLRPRLPGRSNASIDRVA